MSQGGFRKSPERGDIQRTKTTERRFPVNQRTAEDVSALRVTSHPISSAIGRSVKDETPIMTITTYNPTSLFART